MRLEFATQVGQRNMMGRQAPVAGGLEQHRHVPVQLPGAAVAAAPALEEGVSQGNNNDSVAAAVGLRAGSACTPTGGWLP